MRQVISANLARRRCNRTGKDRYHHEGHEEHEGKIRNSNFEIRNVQSTLRDLRVLRGYKVFARMVYP